MRKICLVLLVLYLLGWIIMVAIMGWDNYYSWYQHHKFVVYVASGVELLLCIGAFSKDSNESKD